MPPSAPATVYQLRIRLNRISPMVWRRLLVRDTTTIAELHAIIQLAFGWSDDHLHQFLIYGKAYGIAYMESTKKSGVLPQDKRSPDRLNPQAQYCPPSDPSSKLWHIRYTCSWLLT